MFIVLLKTPNSFPLALWIKSKHSTRPWTAWPSFLSSLLNYPLHLSVHPSTHLFLFLSAKLELTFALAVLCRTFLFHGSSHRWLFIFQISAQSTSSGTLFKVAVPHKTSKQTNKWEKELFSPLHLCPFTHFIFRDSTCFCLKLFVHCLLVYCLSPPTGMEAPWGQAWTLSCSPLCFQSQDQSLLHVLGAQWLESKKIRLPGLQQAASWRWNTRWVAHSSDPAVLNCFVLFYP